ncbi:MAG: cyclodeaminase/cyclohydrolase family protein, partial [Acidobacteriota bacterium]|nr:cyclodeaminase/cyclohydrolase family protein [Acidobacteriota bacterium]
MPEINSQTTLESFRGAAASGQPVPAGVAIAAVSASFALGLLAKVADVSSRHRQAAGSAAKLSSVVEAVANESERMLQMAEIDIAAFEAYLRTQRLPRPTDRERESRRRAIEQAVRDAIEIPLAAARAAARGLDLCAEISDATHAAVLADLGSAASLLEGALRTFLICADSNLRQFAADIEPF